MQSMRVTGRIVCVLVLLALPMAVCADTVTTALTNAKRMIDWSQAGVTGGIPKSNQRLRHARSRRDGRQDQPRHRRLSQRRCGPRGRDLHPRHRDHLPRQQQPNLRGAGPDRTVVKFTAPDPCGGLQANVCMRGPSDVWSGNVPTSNVRNWTAGFTSGTTEITLDSTRGLSVGSMIALDQLDDGSDTNGVYVCATRACSQEGKPAGRSGRAQQQFVRVTAINGNQVSIAPGIHMVNWRAPRQPQAWWWGSSGTNNGLEDMTLDHTASAGTAGIGFQNAHDSWVRNIKSLNADREPCLAQPGGQDRDPRQLLLRHEECRVAVVTAVEFFATSDDLVVNNIFHRITAQS